MRLREPNATVVVLLAAVGLGHRLGGARPGRVRLRRWRTLGPGLGGTQDPRDDGQGAKEMKMRAATGLGWMGLGALGAGATAAGAVAIGALAIRTLAVKRGRIERLNIEELEVGRLHVRKLIVEQEQAPGQSVQEDSGG